MKTKSEFFRIDKNMPVLQRIAERFEKEQPFKGLTIGACLHITNETMGLVYALKAGGAEVALCASNPLSTQDHIVRTLHDEGIHVYGERNESPEQYQNNLRKMVQYHEFDYIIDDGADLTVALHTTALKCIPKGGLEETTAGVNRIKRMAEEGKLEWPVLAVNDSKTKCLFDNVYGTGQSTIDGILRETNVMLAGKTFVIAGYGNCGKGLAQRARGMGSNVVVTEIDPIKALQAHMDGFRVMPMLRAAEIGDIFVTVTGNKDVITFEHMNLMKKNAILANAGHFDVEINMEDGRLLQGSSLKILAEGRLVNLACAEGHPAEVMDMSFANQALGLELLVDDQTRAPEYRLNPGVHNIPTITQKKIARLKLKSLGLEIDSLTEVQKAYTKSWR